MEQIISPSLLKQIEELDVEKAVPPAFQIGWEELLGCDDDLPAPDDIDSLLLAASQMFELPVGEVGGSELDQLLLQASQTYEGCVVSHTSPPVTRSSTRKGKGKASAVPDSSTRYGSPKSNKAIEKARKSAVPKKTRLNTEWAEKTWRDWAVYRQENLSQEEIGSGLELCSDFATMSVPAMNHWLGKFVLEVRTKSGKEYCPDSLYQLCCGLLRSLREANRAEVNLLEDPEFAAFRGVLDGQMKRQNATGKYIQKKKASVITIEMEESLWEKGLLGNHSPRTLLDTLVYLIGLNFALRSGEEHRRLRFEPSQIKIVTPVGKAPYIVYCEDISKTNQGGLKSRKVVPKKVVHHTNEENPARCLVQLFLQYTSLCPTGRPDHALYLTPLKNPTSDCWFSCVPVGHNALSDTILHLMREAGIEGYFTNHSLRATPQ
jgi:hypothetical protein